MSYVTESIIWILLLALAGLAIRPVVQRWMGQEDNK